MGLDLVNPTPSISTTQPSSLNFNSLLLNFNSLQMKINSLLREAFFQWPFNFFED